jgi:hypothetical protein
MSIDTDARTVTVSLGIEHADQADRDGMADMLAYCVSRAGPHRLCDVLTAMATALRACRDDPATVVVDVDVTGLDHAALGALSCLLDLAVANRPELLIHVRADPLRHLSQRVAILAGVTRR